MSRESKRTFLGVLIVTLMCLLMGIEAPNLKPDGSDVDNYIFWLEVKSAVGYFIAATAGAIVSRRSFVVPAVVLAMFGWLAAVYVLYRIVRVAEPASLIDIAASTLFGLVLVLVAGVLGAILGRWFYKREFEHATSAS